MSALLGTGPLNLIDGGVRVVIESMPRVGGDLVGVADPQCGGCRAGDVGELRLASCRPCGNVLTKG